MFKKLILGTGSIMTAVAPIVVVVSCGSGSYDENGKNDQSPQPTNQPPTPPSTPPTPPTPPSAPDPSAAPIPAIAGGRNYNNFVMGWDTRIFLSPFATHEVDTTLPTSFNLNDARDTITFRVRATTDGKLGPTFTNPWNIKKGDIIEFSFHVTLSGIASGMASDRKVVAKWKGNTAVSPADVAIMIAEPFIRDINTI